MTSTQFIVTALLAACLLGFNVGLAVSHRLNHKRWL